MMFMKLHDQPLQFDTQQLRQMDHQLLKLADHTAAPLVMVADVSGQLVLYRGRVTTTQCTGLAALAAGSFAAAREIGIFLGLRESFQHQLLEGRLANLYLLSISEELLLIVAFTQQSMLGMVRIYAQQAQHELLALVKSATLAREQGAYDKPMVLSEDLSAEIQKQLDELFT